MDLRPGDKVEVVGMESPVFIGVISPHPMSHYNASFKHLWLVIWRMDNGEVSFDALSPMQNVGKLSESATPGVLTRALGIKWG